MQSSLLLLADEEDDDDDHDDDHDGRSDKQNKTSINNSDGQLVRLNKKEEETQTHR